MKKFMAILTLFISFKANMLAQSNNNASEATTREVEANELTAVGTAQLSSDENQLLSSEEFADCRNTDPIIARTCIDQKLAAQNNTPPASGNNNNDQENQTDLPSIVTTQSQNISTIERFLQERFQKNISGEDITQEQGKLVNTHNRNYVDQMKYYEIFKNQLEKNVLLEYSRYCLENLRKDSNNSPIILVCANGNQGPCQIPNNWSTYQEVAYLATQAAPTANTPSNSTPNTAPDPNLICANNNNSSCLTAIAQYEYSQGGKYLEAKYSFCQKAVVNMCEIYQCQNTYGLNGASVTNDIQTNCDNLGASIPTRNPNAPATIALNEGAQAFKGRIACEVKSKIGQYREKIAQTAQIIERLKEFSRNNQSGGSVHISSAFKGEFTGAGGSSGKSIDDLTTVGSSELAQSENFKMQEEQITALDACLNEDPTAPSENCRGIFRTSADENNLTIEYETATALEERRLRDLSSSREELAEYLEANGYTDYKTKLENNDLSETEISNILAERFRAERMAVINRLNDQLRSRTLDLANTSATDLDTQKKRAVESTQSELREERERISAIIQYNNIVTSFLTAAIIDPTTGAINPNAPVQRNTHTLNVEREAFNRYGANDATRSQQERESMQEFFNENGQDSATQSGSRTSTLQLGNIDQYLGNAPANNTNQNNGNRTPTNSSSP